MPRLVAALSLCICGCAPAVGGGFKVVVQFAATEAQCVRVLVFSKSHPGMVSEPLARTSNALVVGVAQSELTGSRVEVEARGFAAADCAGPMVDVSNLEAREFVSGQLSPEVVLILDGNAGAVVPAAAPGGSVTSAGPGGSTASPGGTAPPPGQFAPPFQISNLTAPIPSAAFSPAIKLDCGTSKFDSDTLLFTNWCGQATPTPRLQPRTQIQDLVLLPMAGFELAKDAKLELSGSRPVVLVISGDATLRGELNASAKGSSSGVGGPATPCVLNGTGAKGMALTGGGAGGGGFGQPGARGGAVAANAQAFGAGGLPDLAAPELLLRAGCAGGDGAIMLPGDVAALGGGAGGALQVSVTGTLVVEGLVSANGGGGTGSSANRAGGGGGGSGGAIVLEAMAVRLGGEAAITAHSGGGGAGARNQDPGDPGEDGHDTSATVAKGGDGPGMEAGNGGRGGAVPLPTAGENGLTRLIVVGGGGGGGGGAGKLYLRSAGVTCTRAKDVVVSPTATGNCP